MATLASLGGNWTAAGSWALCDAAAANDSETSSTTLTVATQDSPTFIPAAVAIDAVLVKVASRAAGSPSNTITVTLRNSTTATNITSVTINVADIDVCTASDHAGGWYAFKLAATHTPNGTDSYLIRVNVSATTTSVSLFTSASANWARMLRTTTTQAPAAGDVMIVGGEFTGAGTGNNITITMNSTATTQYGVIRGVNDYRGSVSVGKRGTLSYGTTAATNYVLRMAGHFTVHSGGIANVATGTLPNDSTAVLEFVPTASGDSGVLNLNGGTFNASGPPRTSGKNVVRTTLTADAAAAATTLNVLDDTGWLSGDAIRIYPTKRTSTQGEDRILNANAGASSLVVTVGLTNAHDGTGLVAGEITVYTRNIKIRSTTPTTQRTFLFSDATAVFDCEWVEFQGLGSNNSQRLGIVWMTTTGSFTLKFSSFRDLQGSLSTGSTNCNNFILSDNTITRSTTNSAGNTILVSATTSNSWSIINNLVDAAGQTFSGDTIFQFNSLRGTITGNRATGCAGIGIWSSETTVPTTVGTFNNNVSHSNGGLGFQLIGNWYGSTIDGMLSYRNANGGFLLTQNTGYGQGLTIKNVTLLGNGATNFTISGSFVQTVFDTWVVSSEASFTTGVGYQMTSANSTHEIELRSCTFGVTSGHTSSDFNLATQPDLERLSMWNCKLNSTTRINISGNTLHMGSFISETKKDQTAATHQKTIPNFGTLATDTGTFHTAAPSEKLSPSVSAANTTAGLKLRSSPKRAAVANGQTATFSVWVRKDGTYAGAAARLMLRANPAAGIATDTVLATAAAAANTWESLSGTTAAVTDNAVLEVYVDIDGTAGNVFVDDWGVA